MNILYISKPYYGDCDFPLIKAMREEGHNVTVIFIMTPHSLRTNVFNIDQMNPHDGIFPITIYPELKGFDRFLSLDKIFIANDPSGRISFKGLTLTRKLLKFIKNGNFDIINLVETPSIYLALPLWEFRKKLIVTIHDGMPHTGEKNKRESVIRKLTKYYINKYIVLNKAEVAVFSEGYGVPKRKIYTSHLGFYDMLPMYGNPNKQEENYILFFGRISPYKGIEYLLQAMEKVHVEFPNTKVIIAGGGKYYFDTTPYKNKDYIDLRNRFIELDELADLIRGALITVCPYTDATQSGVVYSSFALNTPVIATNVGGLPEMIEDGKTGIIVPPNNIEALASSIIYSLRNPHVLKKMKLNIIESAKHGIGSWKLIAREYLEIYNK